MLKRKVVDIHFEESSFQGLSKEIRGFSRTTTEKKPIRSRQQDVVNIIL